MLRPSEDLPPRRGNRSLGELATQLVDDAKAYARAEVDFAKAVAAEKTKSLGVAGLLFGVALLLAIGAVSALCVAIFVSLAYLMPAWLAGLLTFFIVSAVAGAIGWVGWQKLQDAL
jgi:hypothetical protein